MARTGSRLSKSSEDSKSESRRLTVESYRLRGPLSGRLRHLDHIEDYLRLEAEIARCNFNAAESEFWRVSANRSDNARESNAAEASTAQIATRKALPRALERVNSVLGYGRIPADLYPE
jgi:hypothetical protein